jgi:hypothetical protein
MSNLYYKTMENPKVKVNITQMQFPGGEVGVNVNATYVDTMTEFVMITSQPATMLGLCCWLRKHFDTTTRMQR